jgi:hypothetical protein
MALATMAWDYGPFDPDNFHLVVDVFITRANQQVLSNYMRSHAPGTARGIIPGGPGHIEPVVPVPVSPLPGYNGNIGCNFPSMLNGGFDAALQSISSKSFSSTKVDVAKQIISNNCLLVSQVKSIVGLMDFESAKLDLAKFAYPYTYDIGNYFQIGDVFDFESSVTDLQRFVQSQGPGRPQQFQQPAHQQPVVHQQPVRVMPNLPQANPVPGYNGPTNCPFPTLDANAFSTALQSIRSKSFASTQKTVAQGIIQNNCLTVSQVKQIIQIFDFESDKLEIAKMAFQYTFDKNNYFQVGDVFDYESSVTDLNNFTRGR